MKVLVTGGTGFVGTHVVNALQRHASVVVQKSLVEGFGLTVAEPMWKARPVVASRVGGIEDQIVDGKSGLLLDDPTDLDGCMNLVGEVLTDAELAARLGAAAHGAGGLAAARSPGFVPTLSPGFSASQTLATRF